MRYIVIRPEVIGSCDEGWDVNDMHRIGTIDLDEATFFEDARLYQALLDAEYISGDFNDIAVIGEDTHYVDLVCANTGRPLLAVSREH